MLVTGPSACDKATAASDKATAASDIDLSELEGHDREDLVVMTTAEVEVHAGWHMTQQGIVKQN